jgi:hypothetical protein
MAQPPTPSGTYAYGSYALPPGAAYPAAAAYSAQPAPGTAWSYTYGYFPPGTPGGK